MFTGIVEELGQVVKFDGDGQTGRLTLRGPTVVADAVHGASIAVDGVCLTVVEIDGDDFTVDVMRETLDRSTLGGLSAGDQVNLERAVRASDRLGGHIVQGHVDGVGTLVSRTPGPRWDVVRIGLPGALAKYVAEKGSVAVDGVFFGVGRLVRRGGRLVRGEPDPHDAGTDHARPARTGPAGESRSRRRGQVRRTAAVADRARWE